MSADESVGLFLVSRDLHRARVSQLAQELCSDMQNQPPEGLFEVDSGIENLQDELVVAVTECAGSAHEEEALEILTAKAKSIVTPLNAAELRLHGWFLLDDFDAEERHDSKLRNASAKALENRIVYEWLRLAPFHEVPAPSE
jgi:hypothetical protein